MKKQHFILLSTSLLALASCGGTGALLPSGGTSIDQAEGIKHLSTAVSSVGSDGAFGVKLNNFALNATADVNIPSVSMTTDMPTMTMTSVQASFDASDVTFSAMAQGLKSTDVSAVKAAVDFGGSFKASVAMGMSGVTTSSAIDYSGLSLGAYVSEGNAYLNLSNGKVVDLLNTVINLSSSRSGYGSGYGADVSYGTSTKLTAGKYVSKGVLTQSMLPLLSDSVEAQITSAMSNASAYLTAYKDYFKTYSYSNGNYAIDFSLTNDSLKALLTQTLSSLAASSSIQSDMNSAFTTYIGLISNFLKINACQEVLVYNDKGPVSLAYNVDIAVNTTFGDIVSPMMSSASSTFTAEQLAAVEKVTYKSSYNFSFLSGADVKVTLPTDLSTYTEPTSSPATAEI